MTSRACGGADGAEWREWFATGHVREGLKGRKEQKRAKVEQDLANCVGTRRRDVFGRSKEKLVWYGGDTCALGLVWFSSKL